MESGGLGDRTAPISLLQRFLLEGVGIASGNKIELKLGEKRMATLISQSPFLPSDVRASVYGVYRPKLKTARLTSVHASSSNQEGKLLERLNGDDTGE